MIIEALSSCAIEGNKEAIRLLELQKNDMGKFIIEVERFLEKEVVVNEKNLNS
jgi:hypothetical protein